MVTFEVTSLFLVVFSIQAVLHATGNLAALPIPGQATCQQKLGVEDGSIPDSKLTASTEYAHSIYHGASNARLNRALQTGTTGAWSAQTSDAEQWIQAELDNQKWVTGVMIQGRQDCCPQYVTKFKVQYSDDGVYWKYVQQTNNAGEMIFDGNSDQDTVVTALFPTPVKASFIRIRPTAWNQHISMRFELIGCGANICQDSAGMEDGRIPDGDITASSEFASGTFHGASNGRLNRQAKPGTTGAWSAQTNDINQWIQADLGANVFVTGVMTQGRQDGHDQWLTQFKVQHSNDGVYWKYVQDPSSKLDKVFDGNTDAHTAVVNLFPSPVKASFIRIRPTTWNNHISMRFEVLACNTC